MSILGFLMAIAAAEHGGQIVVVGKNLGSIYRNFFKAIEESPGLEPFKGSVVYRQGSPTAWIMGREVHVIGANDARAESKIRGMTILLVYVDEVTVLPEEFFKQLQARMSLDDSRMLATTNPDSPAHWLKTDFLDRLRVLPDWRRYHFVMSDNPSLSAKTMARLRAQYTGLWFKRFILGQWVSAEGAIFDMWDADKHVVPWASLPPMQSLLSVGTDFGTNHPSTGLMLGLSRERINNEMRSRLYLVDEWRVDKRTNHRQLAPSEQAASFRDWIDGEHLPYETHLKPRFIFHDPAAAHWNAELRQAQVHPTPEKATNNVPYGLSMMSRLLIEEKLVVSDRCQGLIKEMPGYAWDSKKAAQGLDEPVKVNDDFIDGGRYAIASVEQFWQNEIDWPLGLLELAA